MFVKTKDGELDGSIDYSRGNSDLDRLFQRIVGISCLMFGSKSQHRSIFPAVKFKYLLWLWWMIFLELDKAILCIKEELYQTFAHIRSKLMQFTRTGKTFAIFAEKRDRIEFIRRRFRESLNKDVPIKRARSNEDINLIALLLIACVFVLKPLHMPAYHVKYVLLVGNRGLLIEHNRGSHRGIRHRKIA
jgi:hypothetical protein